MNKFASSSVVLKQVLNGAGVFTEEAAEDVAPESHSDRCELFREDQTLAEVSAVVFGEEQAVEDSNLLGHLRKGVEGRDVLSLIHTLDHALHWGDHIQVHFGFGGNAGHRTAVVFKLGFVS